MRVMRHNYLAASRHFQTAPQTSFIRGSLAHEGQSPVSVQAAKGYFSNDGGCCHENG